MKDKYPRIQKSGSFQIKNKVSSVLWITFFWLLIAFYQYFDRYSLQLDKGIVDASYKHWSYIKGLEEEKYFNFLNDTFKISIPGIMSTKGEIYQYVGDEIVVNWKKQYGIDNANCIQCYFEMVKHLENNSEFFQSKYGVQPKFKAGLHVGFVIAGEMGSVKKEIVFSRDVLNTASRIQSMCNDMNSEILISETLMDLIDPSLINKEPKSLGKIRLKGKAEEVELMTL